MKNNLRRLQGLFTILMAAILVAVSLLVNWMVVSSSNESMKQQITGLISSNTHQMELNIDSYFQKVEKVAALLFSDKAYYEFDATDTSLDQYDKIQAEDAINKDIVDLGLMENFSDFGIVYANDESVGWISQTTQAEFAEGGMYDEFAAVIQDEEKQSGWNYGIKENFDRVYYVQRLNPNAIVLVSFYGSELANVINVPEELSDLTVRLVDQEDQILFSSDNTEIGSQLPDEISAMLSERTGISVFNQDYLAISHQVSNGWNLICSIPADHLLAVNKEAQRNSRLLTAIIIIGGIVISMLISQRLNRSMNGVVENLNDMAEADQMTGLLNKVSFMNSVNEDLQSQKEKKSVCFLMLDMDNFKEVNDNMGHSEGDKVLIQMAEAMKTSFAQEEGILLGRVGGDEFAAYVSYGDKDRHDAEERLRNATDALYRTFSAKTAYVDKKIGLGISTGVLIEGPGEYSAEELYKNADTALYLSKKNGKNRKTFI
ncbi:MAG: sensor domain-containing diguanylate cyclase [Eubacterium sp.]|nr:sensor domain-containing diguanylate cyclase [Eubacterium sp.]